MNDPYPCQSGWPNCLAKLKNKYGVNVDAVETCVQGYLCELYSMLMQSKHTSTGLFVWSISNVDAVDAYVYRDICV